MKNLTSRRRFIRDSSLTASGLAFASIAGNNHKALKELAIGCAPAKAAQLYGSMGSVKSGNWSDPATWGGRVPTATDTPLIATGHTVSFDVSSATVSGININSGGILAFDASKTVTLQSSQNIVVQGELRIRPNSASQIHTLRFVDINEKNFVGGGMDPLASDVGLWVVATGRLDIVGAEKTSWTRVTDTVAAGSASFSLKETPIGWAAGDEIVLVPTNKPSINTLVWDDASNSHKDLYRPNFEQRTISSVNGSSVAVSSAFTYNVHQKVVSPDGPTWTAEALNLNRNVRIEGTAAGRTHIFIHANVPQTLQNAALRYMGPRKDQDGNGRTDMIAGRYAIHFHHCNDGSIGSQVTGNVVYQCGNHSYVPHVSNGINMSNNVAYDCLEIAFWWDFGHLSHSITWNNNLIALNLYVPGSKDMAGNESGVLFTGGGMLLGMGDDNVAMGNTVVYAGVGDTSGKGGFIWEANNEGIWDFENNLAHSNHIGIRVWQNTVRNHTVFHQECYNNVRHLFHGAYGNAYTYRGGYFYDGEIEVKASSANTAGVRFESVKFHSAGKYPHCIIITRSAIPSGDRCEDLFLNCSFKGYTTSAIRNEAGGVIMDGLQLNERKGVAMVMCDFDGGQPWSFRYEGPDPQYITNATGWFRIQPKSGQSQMIVRGVATLPIITNIGAFSPTLVGTGKGIKGEYFNDAEFKNKVFERIDSVIMFSEWYGDGAARYNLPIGVHHKITGTQHSVRWTGKVQAQYSEAYMFRLQGAGGYRIWIDGVMVLDKWQEKYDDSDKFYSSPVQLAASKLHDIKVEYYSSGGKTNAQLFWKSPSMEQEVLVPQSQLYAEAILDSSTALVAPNKVPVANAGVDQSITLPVNMATLNGSLSSDPDGTIAVYKWSQVSGPAQFTIADASAASTTVSNLAVGIYTFRLTVTDNKGATATDDVVISVTDALNKGPVAHAGSDITVVLPASSVSLNGSASNDPDGTIASYQWTEVSGPSQASIVSAGGVTTAVNGLVKGAYTFRVQVSDNKGAIATDEVVVTVTDVVNRGPVANAGADQAITLPMSSVTLNASGSYDPDGSSGGTIVSYLWTKISGPTQFALSSASAVTPLVSNLVEGTYVFQLKVADDKGATATDDVTITVQPNISSGQSGVLGFTLLSRNPSSGRYKVKINGSTAARDGAITVCVYNQFGKEMALYRNKIDGDIIDVDITKEQNGQYFLWAIQNEKTTRTWISKQPD
ncbi:PKD domain-containing protein [Flavisolibacter tropicus]|uniref:PA14 domain-containing protein n=1 Tax=Flavisolibacter tropicus TaxID=1492898 RepID=A0A172U1B1_9BACT|nr:PA14 domain-containing protein [Flavisolibacter tropicus]ANE52968.1 hypothetical protein SY85_23330 [Flavisolibacter tropicus]